MTTTISPSPTAVTYHTKKSHSLSFSSPEYSSEPLHFTPFLNSIPTPPPPATERLITSRLNTAQHHPYRPVLCPTLTNQENENRNGVMFQSLHLQVLFLHTGEWERLDVTRMTRSKASCLTFSLTAESHNER